MAYSNVLLWLGLSFYDARFRRFFDSAWDWTFSPVTSYPPIPPPRGSFGLLGRFPAVSKKAKFWPASRYFTAMRVAVLHG
jgi:hypothetical protein